MFDVRTITGRIVDLLNENLIPCNTIGSVDQTIGGNNSISVIQTFVPFSTAWREDGTTINVELYVKKVGSPEDLIISIHEFKENVLGIPFKYAPLHPSLVQQTYSWCTISVDLHSEVEEPYWVSNNTYAIKLLTSPKDDHYVISRSDKDTYPLGTCKYAEGSGGYVELNSDLCFRIRLPNWISRSYPMEEINLFSFPRVTVDISGRPRVIERWIDHRIADYILELAVTVYSRYPEELDAIISQIDNVMWKNRINVEDLRVITPSGITPESKLREGVYSKTIKFNAVYRKYIQ